MRYISFTFSYIFFSVKKVFFSKKNVQYKNSFPYKNIFSGNNVYFVKKQKYFFKKKKIFFNLVLQQIKNHTKYSIYFLTISKIFIPTPLTIKGHGLIVYD